MERKYGRLRRIGNMVRAFCALLCMLLLGRGALAQETPFYTQMPQYLRVTQSTRTEKIKENISVLRTYPDTQNDEVDAQMRLLVDEMAERNRQHLPTDKTNKSSFLDVGSVVRRTGTSVLSFLTTAQVSRERMQLSIDFETRVFDIETGALLALGDLFEPASGVWETLAGHVRAQLSAAFPGEMADEERLGQLCSEAALKEANFTLGAAFLTLTYRADALYPGNNTLLHVHVPYSEIRGLMTEYAQRQTDNSRFQMVALTYDDGPANNATRLVLNELRRYGAQATFFIVGENIRKTRDTICRQNDGLHSVQSHTYTHSYPGSLTKESAFDEKAAMADELTALIGKGPQMMRAPGGQDGFYLGHEIGYPLIHWSLSGGDSGNDNDKAIAQMVMYSASDGDIVLMHDINPKSPKYTAAILETLSYRGILCVTVEELLADAGIELEEQRVYFSTSRIEE